MNLDGAGIKETKTLVTLIQPKVKINGWAGGE